MKVTLWCMGEHEGRPAKPALHEFDVQDLERIIYTLQGMYASAVCDPDDGEQELRGTDAHLMQHHCLLEVLDMSRDIEVYGEWTDETVEARQLAQADQ